MDDQDVMETETGADAETQVSDAELVLLARAGDRAAFAELWERHARSGLRVARQVTSSLDPEDLVSEAYTRIYQRVLDGGGPDGAFRPYLYTTIRNLASRWGAARRDVQIDDIEDVEDDSVPEDPGVEALDRTLTARAFRSLPERWQSVLWYTEVEGMDPHEVAPILGMSANGVAALSYRAREGLRKAWLQAHVSEPGSTQDCRWVIQRLGENARHSLTEREQTRLDAHLLGCAKCAIITEEVDDVGSRLAFVMVPLLLGSAVGGSLRASLSAPASAAAAAMPPMPPMPPAFDALAVASVAAPAVSTGLGAGTALTTPILVGALALSLTVGGGVVAAIDPPGVPDAPVPVAQSQPLVEEGSSQGDAPPQVAVDPAPDADPDADPGLGGVVDGLGGAVGGVADGVQDVVDGVVGDVGSVVDGAVDTITGGTTPPEGHTAPGGVVGADVSLNLSGTGTPGALVSLQAAGQVYATTTVDADGNFTLNVTALPDGLEELELVQAVDRSYLLDSLGLGGLLGGLLGNVEDLVDALIRPLAVVSSGDSPVTIRVLD
jgi:RNA polymerase sigma factor (sigma-70 family)